MIDERACIHPNAKIGNNVSIGPWTLIGPDVEIGDDTEIASHVVINGITTIGKGNKIFQFASIGEVNQDKKYNGEPTKTVIGDHNVIRECVTIHRGTVQDNGITQIGSHNLIMAYAHIAHDCVLADNIIVAGQSSLAGHVHVDDWAIIGGMSGIHQFCQVGAHSFVAAGSIVLKDVPTYVMTKDNQAFGMNYEGLKRRGFTKEQLHALRRSYKTLYREGLNLNEALPVMEQQAQEADVVQPLVAFLRRSQRGIVR